MTPSQLRLLLVEDNPGDARFLQEILKDSRQTEFAITHADRLAPALEMLATTPFDIVLLDLSLPDVSGLDTLIRTHEAAPHVPIVVLTGLSDEAFGLRSVRQGAQDYLLKGQIETDLLVRAIRYAIERHRLQQEHARQKQQIERLAAFVQFNPNPVVEFSPDGRLLYFNHATARMAALLNLGGPEEMLLPETAAIVRETLLSGEPRQNIELRIRDRIVSWSFFPIATLRTVHSYALDVTDRVNLEGKLRHSQKMEAVGQLAAGVAHDFNNFLSLIQGHIDILRLKNPPEEFLHSLDRAAQAVESAADLTSQLLTFSRRQELVPRLLDVNEVIQHLAAMMMQPLGAEITLDIRLGKAVPPVRADAGMLKQVLLNLAVNARDAMPNGGTLTITTEECPVSSNSARTKDPITPGQYVCIQVTDTGMGMDEETCSRIFEPFFSTKALGKGTGLGLATVYGIVNQHKGWIEVTSSIGGGTSFAIYLPARVSSYSNAAFPAPDRAGA
jgi:two-component system, cell cycle sensor histidine kinase and response regulator CckA